MKTNVNKHNTNYERRHMQQKHTRQHEHAQRPQIPPQLRRNRAKAAITYATPRRLISSSKQSAPSHNTIDGRRVNVPKPRRTDVNTFMSACVVVVGC